MVDMKKSGAAALALALLTATAAASLAQGKQQGAQPQARQQQMQQGNHQPMPQQGMNPGMMGHGMMGQGMRTGMGMTMGARQEPLFPQLGPRVVPVVQLSVSDVRTYLERQLTGQNFERLEVGTVEEVDEETISAEIVTVDDSLVQRLTIDRHTGLISREG